MSESTLATFENYAKWSQVIGSIVFAVALILIFRKYLAPAVAAATAARNARIADAESRREHTQAEIARARGEVETADREAASIRARGEADAARERERIVAEAQADGERAVRNAGGELERARLATQAKLRIEFIEKALAQARVAAKTQVDAATDARLVRATLDDLRSGK